jgi:hypothetical protein
MPQTNDLTQVSHGHVPELAHATGIQSPIEAIAVGWLGDRVPSIGAVDNDLRAALEHFSRFHYLDGGQLGLHTCEICGRFAGRGEMLIETPEGRYVLPQLVLHYIADHSYRPPEAFLRNPSRHWGSPEALRCRTDSCGSAPPHPRLEPLLQGEDERRDAERAKLLRFTAKLRDEGLDEEETKVRLLQWARDRVADLEETVDLDALNPASEPAAGKR